jgi:peptidase S41-like protein
MKSLSLIPIVFILACTSNKIGFKNLDFDQQCDTSKTGLCYWELSWGAKGAVKAEKSGKGLCMLITGIAERSVGFAEQTLSMPDSNGMQIVSIAAKIKSTDIKGRGAGINFGAYDADGNLIFTKDLGYGSIKWAKGNSDWKEYKIKALAPSGTSKIKLGAILYGQGEARFDDFKVDIVPVEGRAASALALGYVSAAADSIAKNSLYRDSIDINSLKKTALMIAGPAKTYEDCHLAVEYMIESLRPAGDHHSFFMTAEIVKGWENPGDEDANIHYPTYRVIENCGYIEVPGFHGGNKKLMIAFADSIQKAIKELDQKNIKGWVIDLRRNTGGNMEPMITGLGPIISGDRYGYLVDINGKKESWHYKNGTYYWDDKPGITASDPVAVTSQKPIAVLYSQQTGSSGEIVIISFIGNPKTKSFGQPSYGLTTGNGNFDLKDGSRMMIASTMMADRNGRVYQGRILPDQVVDLNPSEKGDQALRAGIDWIKSK